MYNLILIIILIIIIIILICSKYSIDYYSSNKIYPNLYYINLKHRTDRKKQLLEQLNKINYPTNKITRIDAVLNDKDGHIGCGLSHIKTLEYIKENSTNMNYSIILEDDFVWIDYKIVNQFLNKIYNLKYEWNVILLSCNGNILNTIENNTDFSRIGKCQTASGYIIKHSYIDTLLKVWKHGITKRINNNDTSGETAIDQSWIKLQDESWLVTNPKLGIQGKSYSDIQKGIVDYKI